MHDGAGDPVPDALLEIWQADADGAGRRSEPGSLRRDGCTFTGWGRARHRRRRALLVHHRAPRRDRRRAAPFFAVTVFARGLLNRLFTRAYLPGDEAALAADPLLAVARRRPPRHAGRRRRRARATRFDIRLQGDGETVFLAYPATLTA